MSVDTVHAFVGPVEVLVAGAAQDGGTAVAPLAGVTLAVKDVIDVAGRVTGAGNPDLAASRAPADRSAPAVDALVAAGATVVGKTVTDELAYSLGGDNPHFALPINVAAPGRSTGGSSSGSAAAVAAGLVEVALGTDTGGSIRVPASYCGIYGWRPTHGAVSVEGVTPLSPSFDTVGLLARSPTLLRRAAEVMLSTGAGSSATDAGGTNAGGIDAVGAGSVRAGSVGAGSLRRPFVGDDGARRSRGERPHTGMGAARGGLDDQHRGLSADRADDRLGLIDDVARTVPQRASQGETGPGPHVGQRLTKGLARHVDAELDARRISISRTFVIRYVLSISHDPFLSGTENSLQPLTIVSAATSMRRPSQRPRWAVERRHVLDICANSVPAAVELGDGRGIRAALRPDRRRRWRGTRPAAEPQQAQAGPSVGLLMVCA